MTKAASNPDDMAEAAGCDLLSELPEITAWLLNVRPGDRLVIGAYAYLDGALFLRVSVAMDALIDVLLTKRKGPKAAVCYLCTPTDAHVCPPAAVEQAKTEFKRAPLWQQLFSGICSIFAPRRALKKNYSSKGPIQDKDTGKPIHICDATVVDQGPNYILAKRLQHWRAVSARANGHVVSTNIAPSTRTISVCSNKMFALSYAGMHSFKPFEVFDPDTSNSVMTALLINDLRNPLSVASPDRVLTNPMELFAENSFHGGAWRSGFKFGSIGMASILHAVVATILTPKWLLAYNTVLGPIVLFLGMLIPSFVLYGDMDIPPVQL